MKESKKKIIQKIFQEVKSSEDLDMFFEDILTPREYEDILERFRICKLLGEEKTVQQVCKELGVASATVVRGNRVLKYGTGKLKEFTQK